MDYIIAFNRSIKNLSKQMPNNETILMLNEYMRQKRMTNYYLALDNLGCKLGVEYQCEQVEEEDVRIWYYATIKFGKDNPLNNKSVTERVRYKPFKNQK